MQKYGGAAILMQSGFDHLKITYAAGSSQILAGLRLQQAFLPFEERTADFLDCWSKKIFKHSEAKKYSDVITFAFWIRRQNVHKMRRRFLRESDCCQKGRGVIFHVAPSNVAVNYAYSLAAGLMMGNVNVVRIPSKDFEQVRILGECMCHALDEFPFMRDRICLLKYGHDKEINDALSAICDVRVIWGGDETIAQLRQSKIPPRAYDVCFADRYSLAVIDLDDFAQAAEDERAELARGFYNDTYLTDQNACTSPRMVVWYKKGMFFAEEGKDRYKDNSSIRLLQNIFWGKLWELVQEKYQMKTVQIVDKLTNLGMLAAECGKCSPHLVCADSDYRLMRVQLDTLDETVMQYCGNSGYFMEYLTGSLREFACICGEKCQTIGYFGKSEMLQELLDDNMKGVDRVVPIGKTMDFDLIWDGYNLYDMFTRKISYFSHTGYTHEPKSYKDTLRSRAYTGDKFGKS